MIFRQLFDRESSTFTYLIADAQSRNAAIIDPAADGNTGCGAACTRGIGHTPLCLAPVHGNANGRFQTRWCIRAHSLRSSVWPRPRDPSRYAKRDLGSGGKQTLGANNDPRTRDRTLGSLGRRKQPGLCVSATVRRRAPGSQKRPDQPLRQSGGLPAAPAAPVARSLTMYSAVD